MCGFIFFGKFNRLAAAGTGGEGDPFAHFNFDDDEFDDDGGEALDFDSLLQYGFLKKS